MFFPPILQTHSSLATSSHSGSFAHSQSPNRLLSRLACVHRKVIGSVQFSCHFRYINIQTWLRGFQDKLLYLLLFSLHRNIFWELMDKRNSKPKASVSKYPEGIWMSFRVRVGAMAQGMVSETCILSLLLQALSFLSAHQLSMKLLNI